MSELKPCFCEPCAACFGNGHAFNDLIGRSTRCSICAGTGRVSRAAQITPQAGAEPVKCQHCNGTGEIEPDNNGPIGPCPMCNGKGSYIPRTATQSGEAEPAYYAVVDEEGDVIELTKDKQYAHDFINDAIASAMEQDITLANRWVVRPLYTAPPPPVCPHIRSSKDGTSWCDLAARVGDLSPVAPVWQPIETAPRDEPFVGYFGNGEIHIVEIDSEKNECFRPMGEERWAMPTHWQPLPSPPDSPGATEES